MTETTPLYTEAAPRYTAEQLDHAVKHTLFNMTAKGQCVPLQDVVNRTIWNYGLDNLDKVDRDLLYASIEKAAFASTDLDGNIQYAVSETAGKDGPFFRGAWVPLPDGHFDYVRLKPAEPEPVIGYRQFTQEEIKQIVQCAGSKVCPKASEQINRIKDAGAVLRVLCDEASARISKQYHDAYALKDDADIERLQTANPTLWLSAARQKLQEGLMCLTRAIAQPSSF